MTQANERMGVTAIRVRHPQIRMTQGMTQEDDSKFVGARKIKLSFYEKDTEEIMVKAARKIGSAIPQYTRTFEGYCNALITGLLNPDDYTLAWLKTVENQLATGELTWTPATTPQEKSRALEAVERVGKAIGFKQAQEEAAAKQSRSLLK